MESLKTISEFLKNVALLTGGQLVAAFGMVFVFGLILYLLAWFTRRVYAKSAGNTLDIIITGWIGTPVHELGHAIFCIVFFHKIEKIKLFDPDPKDGSIGYVMHSYNHRNLWHLIGNFFIGIGPLLIGALALYLIMLLLVPEIRQSLSAIEKQANLLNNPDINKWHQSLFALREAASAIIGALFNPLNLSSWKFWLFLYLSMGIASHMELSPPDLKGALSGLITIVLILFLLNLLVIGLDSFGLQQDYGSYYKYLSLQTYMFSIGKATGTITALFIYATIISALNFMLSWTFLSLYTLLRYSKLINPFWG